MFKIYHADKSVSTVEDIIDRATAAAIGDVSLMNTSLTFLGKKIGKYLIPAPNQSGLKTPCHWFFLGKDETPLHSLSPNTETNCHTWPMVCATESEYSKGRTETTCASTKSRQDASRMVAGKLSPRKLAADSDRTGRRETGSAVIRDSAAKLSQPSSRVTCKKRPWGGKTLFGCSVSPHKSNLAPSAHLAHTHHHNASSHAVPARRLDRATNDHRKGSHGGYQGKKNSAWV